MTKSEKTYTYRAGQKIELKKSRDQMVVRALPDKLDDPAIIKSEQVSPASTRITTSLDELESMMSRSRTIAPTHHAYFEAQTGAEFLITDRIFVVFKEFRTDLADYDSAGRHPTF
jgi:hypothetical protein